MSLYKGSTMQMFRLLPRLACGQAQRRTHERYQQLGNVPIRFRPSRQAIEREQVQESVETIMFSDIVGFSELIKEYPVRDVLYSLDAYFTTLNQIIQQHRGYIHKILGDGLMVPFHDPADAVRAGCDIQQAVIGFNARQQARGLWPFETRVAIDTGEVVLTGVGPASCRDYTLIGQAVNRAAHLAKRAKPGTVWISQCTLDGLGDSADFTFCSAHVAQSREEWPSVYEVAYV